MWDSHAGAWSVPRDRRKKRTLFRYVRAGVLLLPLDLASGVAHAQGLAIDHAQVGCVVAEQFPVISARFDPVASLGRARVYFRAVGGPHWYFVEMKAQGDSYLGTLPKPKRSTPQIEYYIEAMGTTFGESRTTEYKPEVVPPPGTCGKGPLAAFTTSAKLVVGAAAGAPAVPLGFSAAGLAAAGGGISTGLLVGVVGAGAAVAGVAAAKGGSSSSPTTATPVLATTQPPPTTAPSSLTGHWVGTGMDGFIVTVSEAGQPDCPVEADVALDISQSGSGLSGMGTITIRKAGGATPLCPTVGDKGPFGITGSVSGSSVTMVAAIGPGTPDAATWNLNGMATANRMSGALTGVTNNQHDTFKGTWALNRQ